MILAKYKNKYRNSHGCFTYFFIKHTDLSTGKYANILIS